MLPKGETPVFLYLLRGAEGLSGFGFMRHLRSRSWVTSQLGNGHALAKGADPRRVDSGTLLPASDDRGVRGGTINLYDPIGRPFGTKRVVGAGSALLPVRNGARQLAGTRSGAFPSRDGGSNHGAVSSKCSFLPGLQRAPAVYCSARTILCQHATPLTRSP